MHRRLSILSLFVLLFLHLNIIGQEKTNLHNQIRFKAITVDDGLGDNRVPDVAQDKYGFIWITTREGISKFDGYNIINYNQYFDDSVFGNIGSVQSLLCDRDGNIWVAGSCVYKFNPMEDGFEKFKDPDFPDRLNGSNNIIQDHEGLIWIATRHELISYNPSEKKFVYFESIPGIKGGIPEGRLTYVQADKNDNIWVGFYGEGLACYYRKKKSFVRWVADGNEGSLAENSIMKLYCDDKGILWVGYDNNGLSKFDPNTKQFTTFFPDSKYPESGRVRGFLKDTKGNFWIGTNAGLYLFNEGENKFKRYAYTDHPISRLSHNGIHCLFEDNQENLWVGTHAGGVDYASLDVSGFVKYDYSPIPSPYFINDKNVYSLAVDHVGNIWVGTEKGGLNYLNRATGKYTYYAYNPQDPNTPLSNNIKDIVVDPQNNIWFAAYRGGVSFFNVTTKKFTNYLKSESHPEGILPCPHVYCLCFDPVNPDILWVGSRLGLYSFNTKSHSYIKIAPGLQGYTDVPELGVIQTLASTKNKLLIGTNSLVVLDVEKHKFKTFQEINGFNAGAVHFIQVDRTGHVWFDSNNRNLISANPDFSKFKVFGQNNELPNFSFWEAADDKQGNLWLSSSRGVVKLINIVNNPDSIAYKVFTKSDNLQSSEFLYHSKAVADDGEILFGGINGFNSFYPENVLPDKFNPVVHITGMVIGNKKVSVNEKISGNLIFDKPVIETKTIKINYRIKTFSIEFVGLHYASPGNTRYEYMLEGYNDEWTKTNANTRFASYSNLPGGVYTFKVKAANNTGIWSKDVATLKIIVKPPFWKTWWFWILVVIFAVLIITLLVKRRERELKRDKEILEEKLREGESEINRRKEEIDKQNIELKEKEKAEEYHKWFNEGLAMISDLLSQRKSDLNQLAYSLITAIVRYLKVEQGGIFFANTEDDNSVTIKLVANYAYDENKLKDVSFKPGEGLIGTCYQKKQLIKIDNLPDTYANLKSGLGEVALKYLILIPLNFDKEVVGVIELISINEIEQAKVDFAEKISENIASTIYSVKSSQLVTEMLAKTQEQSEELHAQEEEMRQTIEELQASHEDFEMREKSLNEKITNLNGEVQELKKINREQQKRLKK